MKREFFNKCKSHIFRKASEVMRRKEAEYFSEEDVLGNLRKIASFRTKETPEAIMTLLAKPLVSISDMVNNEKDHLDPFPMDAWDEKFVDSINYLLKLYASIRENR